MSESGSWDPQQGGEQPWNRPEPWSQNPAVGQHQQWGQGTQPLPQWNQPPQDPGRVPPQFGYAQQAFPHQGFPQQASPQQGFPPQGYGFVPQPGQQVSPYAQPMYPAQIVPKNAGLHLLASFIIPGLGTLLNGETNKGVGIMVGYFACAFTSFLLIPILGLIGLWVWGMIDAYTGAQRWNAQHGYLG